MKKNLTSWITILTFFGCLTAVLALSLLLPDHATSPTENRALAQRPVMDFSDLSALTRDFSDYVVDQFPGRERLLKVYTALELAQNKYRIRNVTRTDDDILLPESSPLTNVQYFSWDVNAATSAHPEIDFVYALLPTKSYLLGGLSPYADGETDAANREALLSVFPKIRGLDYIDAAGYLHDNYTLGERQDMFYRTDFHWNFHGAFTAAEYIGRELEARGFLNGATAPTAEDFVWTEYAQSFMGDLNRRFSYLISTQEDIPYYALRDTSQLRYYLSIDSSQPVERNTILGSELGADELSYNGLSTYNLGFYRLENPNARSNRHVIIFKDSYQNPTTDYFSALFAQVTVIDPRYYDEAITFSELLEQTDTDLVLFLYNQNNASVELREFLTR